jgi:hypothetical protein
MAGEGPERGERQREGLWDKQEVKKRSKDKEF